MLTKTKLEVTIEVAKAKRGLVLPWIDGEAFPLSAEDAEIIGRQLREAAVESKAGA